MTDSIEKTRAEVVGRFQAFATELFAHKPALRSLMLTVAQFWNDQADDEVHAWIVASERDTPIWPHECVEVQDGEGGYRGTRALVPGESCAYCIDDYDLYRLPFSGGEGDAIVVAFEALCREGGSQDREPSQNYAPFAIARRGNAGALVEVVGTPQRAPAVLGDAPGGSWIDERARALLEDIARNPDDDAPRVVLADHLQQAREPLGEAMALALAPSRGPDAQARLDALIAQHKLRWLHPLSEVIAAGCAHFDRGLVRAVDVFAMPRTIAPTRDAPAWAMMETVRIAPGSMDVVDPAMTGVRTIGPLGAEGLATLAGAPRPWAIEHLQVRLSRRRAIELAALAQLTTLPRLRTLVIGVASGTLSAAELAPLTGAAWWPGLAELTLLVPAQRTALALLDAFPDKIVAVAQRGDDQQPAGWQLRRTEPRSVAISQVGWHPDATAGRLAELVSALPRDHRIAMAASRFRTWTAGDLAQLPTSERTIHIA